MSLTSEDQWDPDMMVDKFWRKHRKQPREDFKFQERPSLFPGQWEATEGLEGREKESKYMERSILKSLVQVQRQLVFHSFIIMWGATKKKNGETNLKWEV